MQENRDAEEEEIWLKSDWIERGWITKKPQEGDDWWTAKERDEETTIGRLEIEDEKKEDGSLAAKDRSPSYFSIFSNTSTRLNIIETPNSMQGNKEEQWDVVER